MKGFILTILVSVLFMGCFYKPVLNVHNRQLPTALNGNPFPIESISKAIIFAAQKKGWAAKLIEPGLIEATLSTRTHKAVVEIQYTKENFSINYKDSDNLNYNGESIHRNYNHWILQLSKTIWNEIVNRKI